MNPIRLVLLISLVLLPTPVIAQQSIDPKADELLKKMTGALAAAQNFSFESHSIADQVMPNGQKVQYARNQTVAVRRPDKIRASVKGDTDDLEFVYDGKQVALLDPNANTYVTIDAKSSIDETMDLLATQHGMVIPLADLVFSDPYKALMERARSGIDVGVGYVFESKCRHLAFRTEAVDWQIWIDESDSLPRKLVITYKDQPAHPQFTAFFSKWNLSAQTNDSDFTFTAPAGATKTDLSAPAATTQQAASGSSTGK